MREVYHEITKTLTVLVLDLIPVYIGYLIYKIIPIGPIQYLITIMLGMLLVALNIMLFSMFDEI